MSMTRRFVFALDLKDEPELQAAYRRHHQDVPAAIQASLRKAGIVSMEIYNVDDRLFMIMDVNDLFDLGQKAAEDRRNPDVQAWETLMSRFQQPLPGAEPGEKWRIMTRIFDLPPATPAEEES